MKGVSSAKAAKIKFSIYNRTSDSRDTHVGRKLIYDLTAVTAKCELTACIGSANKQTGGTHADHERDFGWATAIVHCLSVTVDRRRLYDRRLLKQPPRIVIVNTQTHKSNRNGRNSQKSNCGGGVNEP